MRDRTADLLDANQAHSQLSYSPIYLNRCRIEQHEKRRFKTLNGSDKEYERLKLFVLKSMIK